MDYEAILITALCDEIKPRFFVKAPLCGAFTKNIAVLLPVICCKSEVVRNNHFIFVLRDD
jgi:hypothetical protein